MKRDGSRKTGYSDYVPVSLPITSVSREFKGVAASVYNKLRGSSKASKCCFHLYIINLGVTDMGEQEAKQCYTVADLCRILPIGRNAVYRLVNEEGFPKLRVGRKIIIPVRKFHEWIEQRAVE